MNAIVPITNAEIYRASTDAAGLCREIVLKTAMNIQGRKYVKAEGWLAIAVAHGCIASADDVHRVEDEGAGGYRATGIIRRISDGAEIARAEGFVGDDETMWAKRPVYARRAMCQTRAISRACRSAFAHVVVLIDAGLSTTPAEEVPLGGFDDDAGQHSTPIQNARPAPANGQERGIKRLSSARAKELGKDKDFRKLVDACESEAAVEAIERNFDKLTAEHPLSWLDAMRNELILKREELAGADERREAEDALDAEFRATVGA